MTGHDYALALGTFREDDGMDAIRRELLDDPERVPQCPDCTPTTQVSCTACGGDGVDRKALEDAVVDEWSKRWNAGVDRWAALFDDPDDGGWPQ